MGELDAMAEVSAAVAVPIAKPLCRKEGSPGPFVFLVLGDIQALQRDIAFTSGQDFGDQPTTSAACWLCPSVIPRSFIQS
jgi:hypothetical protein